MNKKENLFKLQVFQQTISTLYMYPLRIYKNNCYEKFQEAMINRSEIQRLHELLMPHKDFDFHLLFDTLKVIIKKSPQTIPLESEVYQILESCSEKLREVMWETQASDSLIFTREIKGDRRLWVFLMIYDLFSKEFINQNFEIPYSHQCLIDMQSLYIKLNDEYTLSIGRLFTEEQDNHEIVKTVLKNYNFDNMNIFELITLSKKRRTFNMHRLEEKTLRIKNAFRLFDEVKSQLPFNIEKEELELISIFIYMLSNARNLSEEHVQTKKFILNFSNNRLTVTAKHNETTGYSEKFITTLLRFENNRDFFRGEYASRLKSTLTKRYSGLKEDSYSAIAELLKHICRRLNADGGCYIKYTLADEKLEMIAGYGNDTYLAGVSKFIGKINSNEKNIQKRSRALKVIRNYHNPDCQYSIDELILKNLKPNELLQPVHGKKLLSNIALPLTFQHKLLGILLIDSFREGSFTENDINLILSISSALSVQIFDQIVEKNLSAIMKNLPQQANLDDKSIQRHFEDLTTYINNIFFSYGIAIWNYDEVQSSFNLKTTTLDVSKDTPCVIYKGSNDLIFDLLKNELLSVETFNVEESSRLSSCNPKQYDKRINCVKIYPISDGEQLIGAFSVYNHSIDDYKSIDEQSLSSVTKHLAIFFNIMNTIKGQRALVQSEALHEINARFNMVDDKTRQLKELVTLNFKELDHYSRYRFVLKLEDINNLISNTRLSFQYIANKSNAISYLNHVDEEIINLYKPLHLQEENQINNVRHIFNELSNATPYPYNNKKIRINNMIHEKLNLKVHNLILSDIFQNILLNAVKYSFQGTTIRLFSKERSNTIRISIKNDGLQIRDDEEYDIFKYGYRGFSTKEYSEEIEGEQINYESKENENLGIGLYKCNQLVKKILGGEIRLKRESSTINNGAVNTFEIIFPKLLLDREESL